MYHLNMTFVKSRSYLLVTVWFCVFLKVLSKNNKTSVHQVCIKCAQLKSLKMSFFFFFSFSICERPTFHFMGCFPISDKFFLVLFIAFLVVVV